MPETFNMKRMHEDGVGSFDAIPRGRYTIRSEEAKKTTSQTGNDMIEVTFVVTGPTHANRKVWDRFVWKENCMWKLLSFLDAASSPLVENENLDISTATTALNRGLTASALIEVAPYTSESGEKKQKNTLSNFAAPDEPVEEPVSAIFK